jgi:cardiolipin synthase
MRFAHWLTRRFIPWTRGRMFRTGVALDQPVVVTRRVFTVANGITLIRLLGLPVFVHLVWRHEWMIAFLLVGVLACLDSIDGYVARRFNQATKLGAALDPVTDRLTVVTLVVALSRVPVTRTGKLATMALLVGLPFLLLARVDLPVSTVLHAAALTLACVGMVLYYAALGQYVRAGLVGLPPESADALRGSDG